MRAGKLNRRVIVQAATETRDSHGQPIPSWSTFAKRWARVDPLTGAERFSEEQELAQLTHQVTIRYTAGVRPKQRVLVSRAATHLAGAIDDSTTAVDVTSAEGFPPEREFRARIGDELVLVTAGHGTTSWTVTRGADGTTSSAHADGAAVMEMVPLDIETVAEPGLGREMMVLGANEVDA